MRITAILAASILTGAGAVGLTWGNAPCASACSCIVSTTQEKADRAELVGQGTVVGVERPADVVSSEDGTVYTIELDRIWKGDATTRIEVQSPTSSASCGLEGLTEGMEIVLFAGHGDSYGEQTAGWHANVCGGTGPVDEQVTADLDEALGAPRTPAEGPESPQAERPDGASGGALAPLGLIAASGLLAGVVAWFRQSR